MRILRLYCLRELTAPFFFSLVLFTFIFMVGNLVKVADLLLNKGVNILDIVKILLLLIPQLVIFVLPTSAIAAVLLVFGGFAQNNEITAMKANGVNVWRVTIPVILVGFLLSFIALFFSDQIQPRVRHLYRTVLDELIVKRPEAYIESGKFIKDFKGYILRVQKVEGKRLEGVTIIQPENNKPTRTIVAEWGEIMPASGGRTLSLRLYNGVSDEPSPDNPSVLFKMHFDKFLLPALGLTETPHAKAKRKMKDLSLNELIMVLRDIKKYKELLEEDRERKPEDIEKEVSGRRREAKSEIQRKISFAFATFSFVLIGLPLAVITRHGEAVVSFALSMAVVAIYYILSIWANTMAVNGILPPVIVFWIPNFLAVAVAIFLMVKIIRL